jgi:hypothetical protein
MIKKASGKTRTSTKKKTSAKRRTGTRVVAKGQATATTKGVIGTRTTTTDLPKGRLRPHLNHLFPLTNRQLLDSLN